MKQKFYPQIVTRRTVLRAASMLALAMSAAARAEPAESFDHFLAQLRADAAARGVTAATFAAAFGGVTPDPTVMVAMRREPEYGKPMPAYLASLVSPTRIVAGQHKLVQWADTLRAVQQRFGVDPAILVSIWGVESGFGEAPGGWDVFRSLATLAAARFQHPLFRNELISALVILQQGKIPRGQFAGSWAGAMGQPQFLPSSYLRYAVDFDGDGRADIWNSVPDALASAAKQLVGEGWQRGVRWAYEVHPPADVDCTTGVPQLTRPIGAWLKLGFVPAYGRKPSAAERAETASLVQPAGLYGPSFLATPNYFAIKQYNYSDLYVLFVGHLADRMLDPRPFETPWGKVAQLPTADLDRMQRILTARGLYHDKIDGKAGMLTRAALGEYQKRNGLKLDCWPTAAVLAHMEASAQ